MKQFKILLVAIALVLCATDAFCVVNPIKWKYTDRTPKHEENRRILNQNIIKFDAISGEYAIFNTATGEYIDHSAIFMDQYKPLVFGNVSRLFNFAVVLHSGVIKENEVAFYGKDNKISKEARDELFQSLGLRERNMITDILSAYVKLLKNEDNYLTQSQLDTLKKALLDSATSGKAKNSQVDGCSVSSIGSTQQLSHNRNEVMTTFIGEFNANGQHYAIMTILNKPMPRKFTYGFNSAGWNTVIKEDKIILTNDAEFDERYNPAYPEPKEQYILPHYILKNFIMFRQAFTDCVMGKFPNNLDYWTYACGYLLMDNKDFHNFGLNSDIFPYIRKN